MKNYKKAIVGLLCLVGILTLSNLGTLLAVDFLAKDTVARSETNTIGYNQQGDGGGDGISSHGVHVRIGQFDRGGV